MADSVFRRPYSSEEKATPGKFVRIGSGDVFDGWESRGYVADKVTKAGVLPINAMKPMLPAWGWHGRVDVGSVARYNAQTEIAAAEIREHIRLLESQLQAAQERLLDLYAYQAGPQPARPEEDNHA